MSRRELLAVPVADRGQRYRPRMKVRRGLRAEALSEDRSLRYWQAFDSGGLTAVEGLERTVEGRFVAVGAGDPVLGRSAVVPSREASQPRQASQFGLGTSGGA